MTTMDEIYEDAHSYYIKYIQNHIGIKNDRDGRIQILDWACMNGCLTTIKWMIKNY